MKVLLVCSGGMSSAIVVKAIENEAKKTGVDILVKAIGTGQYEDEVREGWDAVLVAPQVRHRLDTFKKTAEELGIPIAVITPQGYSPMGGSRVIDEIKKLI
ncbi:MAG: phosphotransferase system, lactose/cellobiose-specific subunit [Clostridia bacterium]|nr:phosphotransferase system, lactose/cellobiose-specific subunit [Clostridia bacterium]